MILIEIHICCTRAKFIWHSSENTFPTSIPNTHDRTISDTHWKSYLLHRRQLYLTFIRKHMSGPHEASTPDTHSGTTSDTHWKPYLLHSRQLYLTLIWKAMPGAHVAIIPDNHEGTISDTHWKQHLLYMRQLYLTFIRKKCPIRMMQPYLIPTRQPYMVLI